MAFFDWLVLQFTVTIVEKPECSSFGCFTNAVSFQKKWRKFPHGRVLMGRDLWSPFLSFLSFSFIFSNKRKRTPRQLFRFLLCLQDRIHLFQDFRAYWGLSNMLMNLASCLLTVLIIYHLKNRPGLVTEVEKANRGKIDKSVGYCLSSSIHRQVLGQSSSNLHSPGLCSDRRRSRLHEWSRHDC